LSKKFVVCGDLHYRGSNPKGRTDNFQEALNGKLYEVFQIARNTAAEAVIIPGDLLDSPNTSWGVVADLACLLAEKPCPVLVVHGNHDIWGANPETKRRTPFGLLSRLGLTWDLGEEPYECGFGEDAVSVTGHGFDINTDLDIGQFNPMPHLYPWKGIYIHVVHSMLLDRAPGFEMRHTLVQDVKTMAQVIISGHEHIGFGIRRREDGVLFINPGALCRLSAHPAEIERQVQVVLLTVDPEAVTADLIPLTSARPGHEVLSRTHLEEAAERRERITHFLELLSAGSEDKYLEIREIIESIARREDLPREVVEEALARIGRAREELGAA